ncbi:5-deoxy-glucuronate isomerase [Terrarubrum flagellatum]|uniref:5-deoxy-glucuronate isomerase n=1 Tax=Terrirubrum flagellatum TaxID=2895980 RepID=UPI00314527B4
MPEIIRRGDNRNRPVVIDNPAMERTYFNLVRLGRGEIFEDRLPRHECVCVAMSGTTDIVINGERFASVGGREDVWSGAADSVYAPVGSQIRVEALEGPVEIAIGGAICKQVHRAFRVSPQDVEMVDVGSQGTHSRRRIFHILGQSTRDRTGNLLVSELYADEGCWSGYPPHKHDTDISGQETSHEELYHYRFQPETGFGVQLLYEEGCENCFMTRDGDTVLVDRGYHPTATSPGHKSYIFTILVGRESHGLIQSFDPRHAHLVGAIPGIQAMRDKFK